MKSIFIFFILLLSFFEKTFSQDQNISLSGFPDTEPYLAINPANQNNLIAAWMHMGINLKMSIYTKTSFDGGFTWGNQISLPHVFNGFTSADPSITFNSAGDAFISYVDYKNTLPIPDSGYVCIAKSSNGGNTWSAPVKAVSAADAVDLPVDRPWIVCDQAAASAYKGRLYIVSKSYYASNPPQKVWLSVSSDSGNTWTPIKQLDDSIPTGLTNIMGTPTIGADGSLYVAYISYKPILNPNARVIVTKSTDGGATFIPYDAMQYAANSGNTDSLYQGSYNLSANPANPNNIIFQGTDSRYGDMDVLSVYSIDAGITWSQPLRVNDDPQGNGFGQDMSWGAVGSSGQYIIAWRDRRNGITNDTSDFEVWGTESMDGGVSFNPNWLFSSQKSPFINIQRGNDFLGVCVDNSFNPKFSTVWCDQRTGNTEIFFSQQFCICPVGETCSSDNFKFSVFPNPSAEGNVQYKIEGIKAEGLILEIVDVNGKHIFSKELHEEEGIVSAGLNSGNYFAKLILKSKIATVQMEVTK